MKQDGETSILERDEHVLILVKKQQECGIKAGETFFVAGFDDTNFHVLWSPSITDQIYLIPRAECRVVESNVDQIKLQADEFELIRQIGQLINIDDFDGIEQFVVHHEHEVTRHIAESLTMLPIPDKSDLQRHASLYEAVIRVSDPFSLEFGLRGAIRYEMIKDSFNGEGVDEVGYDDGAN